MLQFQPASLRDADKIGAWTALNPGAEDQFEADEDASLALRRECNGRSILLLPALGALRPGRAHAAASGPARGHRRGWPAHA